MRHNPVRRHGGAATAARMTPSGGRRRAAYDGKASPEARLRSFVGKFDRTHQGLIRAVRRVLRKRLPTATELVYDNYNFLVVGFAASERPSEAILSIVVAPRKVALAFLWGKALPDPHKLLQGSGNQVRNLRLEDAAVE